MAVVVMAAGLGLAGCGEQMAKLEQSQSRLQAMVETNAEQIAAIAARIEQNQTALQAGLEDLRGNIQQVAAKTTAISQEQLRLREAIQDSSRQLTAKVAVVEQNQHELRAGIENVQNDARTAAAEVASDIKAVADEQTRLYETVQSNSQQLANNVAVIEQNQQDWQGKVEGLQGNIQQQVAVTMDALGKDLLRLQETLQQNARDLVSMMELAGQDQLKFREKTQASLRALDESLSALKQSQNRLQSQIQDVQNRTESMGRDVPEALAKLTDELARMGIVERAEIMDIDEPSSSSPPSESDGSEP
jgi:chromosome segregation ATPase